MKRRALIVGLALVGLLFVVFVAHALRKREVRVEVEARDGAILDGLFAATGNPLIIVSNSTSTNLARRSNGFSFVFNNSTNVGTVRLRAYLDGEFQGEASSGDGVAGWFKPVMGQTKVSVHSLD